MNSSVFFIPDKNLSDMKRAQIIALKQQHWFYNFNLQEKWMRENLNGNDLHVLAEKDDVLLAYLNLVYINISIDSDTSNMLGIGNVCTDKEHLRKGYATELIKKTNDHIASGSKSGLLLCHEPLVEFYRKCGWTDISNYVSEVFIGGNKYYQKIMSYNLSADIKNKCIKIDRNF